jgi:HPt (histidine-containing phosphotransfer) domain-containing protein
LGHSTKGAALGYGFQTMGGLGLQIEDAAKNGSASQVQVLIGELENYLAQVKIVYV